MGDLRACVQLLLPQGIAWYGKAGQGRAWLGHDFDLDHDLDGHDLDLDRDQRRCQRSATELAATRASVSLPKEISIPTLESQRIALLGRD